MDDAKAFASINPNSNPIVLNKNQERIVQEQINSLSDPVLKDKAQKAYDEAKKNGVVAVK